MRKWIDIIAANEVTGSTPLREGVLPEPLDVEGREVLIWRNPSIAELAQAMRDSSHQLLRGFVLHGEVIVWDASEATHRWIEEAILFAIDPDADYLGEGVPFLVGKSEALLRKENDWSSGIIFSTGTRWWVLGLEVLSRDGEAGQKLRRLFRGLHETSFV